MAPSPQSGAWYTSPAAIVVMIAVAAVVAIAAIVMIGGGDGDDVATDDATTADATTGDPAPQRDTRDTPDDPSGALGGTDTPTFGTGGGAGGNTGGIGLDLTRDQQDEVLELTWDNLAASDRENLCDGVELFGLDGAAELFNEGAENAFERDLIEEKLSSWCPGA